MQRGILKLSNQELDICLQQLANSTQNIRFLKEKLMHARQTNGSAVTVELSEDEVDVLLDVLPAPNANEVKELTKLRQNLRAFLMDLRDGHTKAKISNWSKLNPFNWFK